MGWLFLVLVQKKQYLSFRITICLVFLAIFICKLVQFWYFILRIVWDRFCIILLWTLVAEFRGMRSILHIVLWMSGWWYRAGKDGFKLVYQYDHNIFVQRRSDLIPYFWNFGYWMQLSSNFRCSVHTILN